MWFDGLSRWTRAGENRGSWRFGIVEGEDQRSALILVEVGFTGAWDYVAVD